MEIPAFADLLDLQEVDLEIDRLLHRRQSLPELERYKTVDAERAAAAEVRDEIAERNRVLGLELDKAEGELEILEQRLKESETRLYAGGMSAKETEHKQLEVQSLGGQRETMEERVLAMLDQRDTITEELDAAQAEVDRLSETERELEAVIAAEWREIDGVLSRREARKAEIAAEIPDDLMEIYEQLRRTKEGVAVSRMVDGQCGGCHLHLSATEQVEAAASDPPRCVHCRRLLVV